MITRVTITADPDEGYCIPGTVGRDFHNMSACDFPADR
jgi:hypothetical protein